VLSQVSPSTSSDACSPLSVSVTGNNFTSASQVTWNGSTLATTFVSATQMTATIPVADLSASGIENVGVTTAGAANDSAALPFTISNSQTSPDAVSFQINPAHSGYANMGCAIALPNTPTWTARLAGAPSYTLIADGKVFVTAQGSNAAFLYALDQQTGAVVWGPIEVSASSAAYDNGQIFIGPSGFNNSALVSAYSAANGSLNWSAVLPGQYSFSSGVTAANGFVYTGGAGDGGTIYALSESSGALAWTAYVANGDDSTPAVTATGVYVAYPCFTYALDPANGGDIWVNSTGCDGGGGGTPIVANGVLYSPSGNGGYSGTTFNPSTGKVLGSYSADVLPSFDASNGYFLQGGTLRGVSLTNNTVMWRFAGDGTLTTSPITVSSYTFIGSSSGNLYAVDNASGKLAWTYNIGSPFSRGASWNSGVPLTGLSAGAGMLVVPGGNALIAFRLAQVN